MVLQNLLIQNSYLVELNLTALAPAVGRRASFQDVPQLRNVLVYGVQCISETELSKAPSGATTVAANGCAGAILTLNIHGPQSASEDIFQYPCFDLVPNSNAGLIRWFNGIRVDLPKSYVTLTDVSNISASESFVFNFIYRKL